MSQPAGTAEAEPRHTGKGKGKGKRAEPIAEALLAAAAPAVEAMLICTERPLPATRIGEALVAAGQIKPEDAAGADRVAAACIERLNQEYERAGRAFRVDAVAGGYRVMTVPEQAAAVAAIRGAQARTALSRAAVETLAIIAYKQPLTRASLEAIRGVACGEILRSLIDRRLVTIAGRAEEPGRPMLYGTTKRFLEIFGLASLKDLPSVEEFRARAAERDDDEGGEREQPAPAAEEGEPERQPEAPEAVT